MTLLNLILTLAIFGFVLWLITTYIPMAAPIKNVIVVIAVIILILFLVQSIGGLPFLNTPVRVR